MTAEEALNRLKEGNRSYLQASTGHGDISPARRRETCENGQTPHTVIIGCSDSRVIPESIFDAGIGELFVIRVAGNVIDDHQLGSIEYAVDHLGSRLIVVLGHDHCGAVAATLGSEPGGYIKTITDEIRRAIGDEKNPDRACCRNVEHTVSQIVECLELDMAGLREEVKICGAICHIATGEVEFL